MNRVKSFFKNLKSMFSKVHFVDRCLILFMIVLMLQSAYSLFSCNKTSSESNTIDIIVRTASASIFGYFISANFIKNTSSKRKDSTLSAQSNQAVYAKTNSSVPQNTIGFSSNINSNITNPSDVQGNSTITGIANSNPEQINYKKSYASNKLQIAIATAIGLFCLITLIVLKNTTTWSADITSNTSIAATVAQFRDFVSGCVGFLIGCPTNENEDS